MFKNPYSVLEFSQAVISSREALLTYVIPFSIARLILIIPFAPMSKYLLYEFIINAENCLKMQVDNLATECRVTSQIPESSSINLYSENCGIQIT